MVAKYSGCDPARIRLLLEDRLTDAGQTQLEHHLETCVECRAHLEVQAAGERWWREAREFLASETSEVSKTSEVFPAAPSNQVMRGSPDPAPAATEGLLPRHQSNSNNEPDIDLPFGLLEPSDNSAILGRLGVYEIVEVIGRGGMGVVLKGFDAALNRHVAIKVLAPHLASSGAARQRFAREAQAAAAVVHEHVVAIHGIHCESGLPYLVMPYIAGPSLAQRLDRDGPLELKQILRIGAQVAHGLAAAHAKGLVHRDIKPANILLENGVERVKITDFGLARAVDDATVTLSGFLAGTPQYMAPEQARGELIDHRCDLFSLGSVFYAMCTGHSPFRAETTMAVLRRICEDSPTPVRQVNADVPEWLAEIIDKLHAKDPAERFQSATEVAELLERHLAHCQQPMTVPMPPPLGYRSPAARAARRRFYRRLAGSLLVLAAGIGVVGWEHWRGRTENTASRSVARPEVRQKNNFQTADVSKTSEVLSPTSAETNDLQNDSLPGEMEGIGRDLDALEARGNRLADESSEPTDSLPELRNRLDELERELDREGP